MLRAYSTSWALCSKVTLNPDPDPNPNTNSKLFEGTASSLEGIIAGRVVYGLGIGTAMHVAPLYIAETAPDNLRGKLVSYKEAAIVAGIILG